MDEVKTQSVHIRVGSMHSCVCERDRRRKKVYVADGKKAVQTNSTIEKDLFRWFG